MSKSVREQVEASISKWTEALQSYRVAIDDLTTDHASAEASLNDARYVAALVLHQHAELFASSEELQQENARLRGVIEEAIKHLEADAEDWLKAGFHADAFACKASADHIRAELSPQPVQGGVE